MVGVGVIGYGYWGPNLVRNFFEIPGSHVVAVSDLQAERLTVMQARYPSIQATLNWQDLLNNPAIDAIAIATPVSTHIELALQALRAGKHVLVTKPLTATVAQGEELLAEAERRQRVLMVDHTFVYTGAVRKIKDLIDHGQLGRLYYYDSVRVNLGLFQHDVNVLWDLAAHDLSIMFYVLGRQPRAVMATGVAHIADQPENIAYLTCFFDDNLIAHCHLNWLAPVKVRRTLICGDQKMIVYDDLQPSEKVKVYDKGVTVDSSPESVYQMLISYRTGDMWVPKTDATEALQMEVLHFIHCIETGEQPITNGQTGLDVVRTLEVATQSMAEQGRLIELDL